MYELTLQQVRSRIRSELRMATNGHPMCVLTDIVYGDSNGNERKVKYAMIRKACQSLVADGTIEKVGDMYRWRR